jgi:hypothetical protein
MDRRFDMPCLENKVVPGTEAQGPLRRWTISNIVAEQVGKLSNGRCRDKIREPGRQLSSRILAESYLRRPAILADASQAEGRK